MASRSITSYLIPWKFKRDRAAEQLRALRSRHGDRCARCRRPIRFDLSEGHDHGAAVELVVPRAAGGGEALDNLRLCHRRCYAPGLDHTGDVTERVRRKAEAELFAKPSRRKRKAA